MPYKLAKHEYKNAFIISTITIILCFILYPIHVLTGATATVSTLATVVGQPNTPTLAGKGGLRRGLPCLPSRLSIRAYTSGNRVNVNAPILALIL